MLSKVNPKIDAEKHCRVETSSYFHVSLALQEFYVIKIFCYITYFSTVSRMHSEI